MTATFRKSLCECDWGNPGQQPAAALPSAMSHIIYHSDGPAGAARGLPRLLDIPPLWLVW